MRHASKQRTKAGRLTGPRRESSSPGCHRPLRSHEFSRWIWCSSLTGQSPSFTLSETLSGWQVLDIWGTESTAVIHDANDCVPRASCCQLMPPIEADGTTDFLEDVKLIVDCLWTFILSPSFEVGPRSALHIDWLSRDLFALAGGNAPRPGVPIPVHSFKLSAKTSAVCGERDWRNWKWWQAEIKHNQVQFTRSKVKVFLSFLFASDCPQQLTSDDIIINLFLINRNI